MEWLCYGIAFLAAVVYLYGEWLISGGLGE